MKQKLIIIALVLVVLAGLGLLLYPTVSDYVNSLGYRRTVEEYRQTVQTMDDEGCERLLEEAREYNATLRARSFYPLTLRGEELDTYRSMLDVSGTGIMGYVVIPSLEITLPIYHGTDEAVLQSGVGHLAGSSLPVGGEGTHAVLAGHTGLPSTELFTHINQLKIGDQFYVRVLNETLTYEVDQMVTLKATDPKLKEPLRIEEGMDYCTLQTCTPYGVNSHRLFVRGHRVPTPEDAETPTDGGEDTVFFGEDPASHMRMLVPAAAALLLAVVILVIVIRFVKKRKKKKSEDAK